VKRRIAFVAMGVASILALSAGSVLAIIPGTPDAAQTSWDTDLGAPVEISVQTFVPTISGSLGTVEVHTTTYVPSVPQARPALPTNVTVAIFPTTAGGFPTGSAMATKVVTPVDGGWTTVSFGSPTDVVSGTKYALEVAQGATDTTLWDFLCSDAYGPGQALVLNGSWQTIHQFDGNLNCLADFAFRTWIVTPAGPTAPPTATVSGPTGDTPSNPGFLLLFAGLASAAAFVTVSRRHLLRR
jgi:hypothetical protein